MSKAHHIADKPCFTRPAYREPCVERAVKAYTINQESQYLLVQNVPAINVGRELVARCEGYGTVAEHKKLDDFPCEDFTEVYWVKYQRIASARFAKRKLDECSFYGGKLHVCYAPEYESVSDTREKMRERRRVVARKCKEYKSEEKGNAVGDSESCGNFLHDPSMVKGDMVRHPSMVKGNMVRHPSMELCRQNNSMDAAQNGFFDRSSGSMELGRNAEVKSTSPNDAPCPNNPISKHNTDHSSSIPNFQTYVSGLPRLATKNATLPVELQNLPAEEIYPAYYREREANRGRNQVNQVTGSLLETNREEEMHSSTSSRDESKTDTQLTKSITKNTETQLTADITKNADTQSTADITKNTDTQLTADITKRRRKFINWNEPLSKTISSVSSTTTEPTSQPITQPSQPSQPSQTNEPEKDELSSTMNSIREKLNQSAEPPLKKSTFVGTSSDPLQGASARMVPRVVVANRKRNDGRKRI